MNLFLLSLTIMMTCCCFNTTTIIINTKNNRKENKSKISVKSNVKMKTKQNRSVPSYSNIYRRKLIEEFTPAPRNNGHAKPTSLPKPSFRPNKWPYNSKKKSTSQPKNPSQTESPNWTFNPPPSSNIESAIVTHFSVQPVQKKNKNKFSDTVDQLIHSLSVQNYPQIIKGPNKSKNNNNRDYYTTSRPPYSPYYPIATSHGIRTTTSKPTSRPFTVPQNLVTWMSGKEYVNYNFNDYDDDYSATDFSYNYDTSNNYFYDYNNVGITGANVLTEMRPGPTKPSFITGQNVISEMRPQPTGPNFISGVSEMAQNTRPSFITGSNVINEMRPQPTRPQFSPTPSSSTTHVKPAITFVHTTSTPSVIQQFVTKPTYRPDVQTVVTEPTYRPLPTTTTKFPNYRPTFIPSTFKPIIVTVPTTSPTTPPYTGPPTYKPTYKPGFHLTPTPLPTFPTIPTTTVSTTPNPYKPTFKPAILATFRPTLPWFTTTTSDQATTTPGLTLPTYPFPILPQFDPSTTSPTSVFDITTTTSSTAASSSSTVTESTTSPIPVLHVAGIDGLAIPASTEAFIFYLETLNERIRDVFGGIIPSSDDSSQDAAQSFAAVSTVIGLPLVTGLMSLLGVGPAIIIGLSWLAPLILLVTVPSLAG